LSSSAGGVPDLVQVVRDLVGVGVLAERGRQVGGQGSCRYPPVIDPERSNRTVTPPPDATR
jgi:hypothetical protein